METLEANRPRSAPASLCGNKVKHNKIKSPSNLRRCAFVPSNSRSLPFPKVWNELRLQRQLCDGTLHSNDGKTLYIHRIILCAVSPYFKDLIIERPKDEPEINEIKLDIPGHILDRILDYAYTGHCNVTSENVKQLLPIADHFGILGILHQCSQCLLEELQPENSIGLFKLARQYFLCDLEDRTHKYICHNFKQIVQHSPEFNDLSAEELEYILCDDELNVEIEEFVFEAVIRWAAADLQARERYLRTLIRCVRYRLMSLNFFTNLMNNQITLPSPELQNSLYSASGFLAELNFEEAHDRDLKHSIARPRIPHEIIFAVGGWSDLMPTRMIETYDIRADKWLICKNHDNSPRAYYGMCVLDNLMYMVGGYDGTDFLSTVRSYNPVTQEWKNKACMYHPRCFVSVCSQDGKIYALGGFDGRIRLNFAERYSPYSNQWEMIPEMHFARSDASAASLNGKIYIAGGLDGEQVLRSVEMFDPDSDQWTFIHSMESPRSGVNLVAYNNHLYALGGFDNERRLSSGEIYNPSSYSNWQQISEMSHRRSNFAAVVLDGKIFVFGGFNGSSTIGDTEYYDVDSNEWYSVSSMNLNRSALNACVLAGLPNAKEYSYNSRKQGTDEETLSDTSSY